MAILKKFALSGTKAVKPEVPVGIVAVGSYIPPTILKNEDFVNVELSEDGNKFVQDFFGFKERRHAKGESFTEIEIKAAKNALTEYKIDPLELDLVISTHASKDMSRLTPPNADWIKTKIGANNATSFNVDAGFNGWLNSIMTAAAFIGSGYYDTVLVVSGETPLRELDCNELPALFFGEAAGAFVLKRLKDGEEGLLGFHLMSKECIKAARVNITGGYGNYYDKHYEVRPYVTVDPVSFQRDAPLLEKTVPYSIEQSLQAAGLTAQDVNLFIFGQQYMDVNKKWAYNLGVKYEKVYDTLGTYGCMKTASIAVNTYEAVKLGKLKKGDIVAYGDQGANWSISAAIFRWCI